MPFRRISVLGEINTKIKDNSLWLHPTWHFVSRVQFLAVWLRKYIKIKKVLDFRKSVLNVKISVIFPCFHTDIFLVKNKTDFFLWDTFQNGSASNLSCKMKICIIKVCGENTTNRQINLNTFGRRVNIQTLFRVFYTYRSHS